MINFIRCTLCGEPMVGKEGEVDRPCAPCSESEISAELEIKALVKRAWEINTVIAADVEKMRAKDVRW